ncbi:hypothetical protein CR513_28218, partial [Mucuna pruriens]
MRFDDGGSKSTNGQDADNSTTSDLEHDQQHAIVRNQRNHSTQNVEYLTDMCSILQETEPDHRESVGSIGGYQYEKQLYAN